MFCFRKVISFCIFILCTQTVFSASLVSRGVVVGLPLGAKAAPGFIFDNISVYFSEPQQGAATDDTIGEAPVVEYSTKTTWLDNQFRFLVAPAVEWRKGPGIGNSWHYGIVSPLFLGGVVHEFFPGVGIAEYVGGMAPLRAGVSNRNEWVFVNLTAISYFRDDYDVTLSVIYGNPGPDLLTNVKNRPNFLNMDFTATKKLGGIEIGPIWYSSRDLNTSANQNQFAVGGLVGFKVYDWIAQFWFGHDLYAYNYSEQTMNGYFRLKKIF